MSTKKNCLELRNDPEHREETTVSIPGTLILPTEQNLIINYKRPETSNIGKKSLPGPGNSVPRAWNSVPRDWKRWFGLNARDT